MNSYGHPHAETLNNLRAMGIYVFRTDEQGSIVATSDGKTISWNCNPSESWQAGEPKGSSQDDYYINESSQSTNDDSSSEIKYIINTNTKKFHYPTCSSVSDMKDKNKKESMDSRDDIISQGYSPCKRCNP